MRTSTWTPSIVLGGDDDTVYLVKDNLGRLGAVWREADSETTDLETVIADLLDGQAVQLAPFEQGEIGPGLFQAACKMELEVLVSNRRDRPYRAGRSLDWVRWKNPKHPAMTRVMEAKRR